ncbi:MAG: hypothetical protein HYZ53_30925 [Planctomycetes bacterium]|nr:hypothetical protein [Planctomycetota bacterium]
MASSLEPKPPPDSAPAPARRRGGRRLRRLLTGAAILWAAGWVAWPVLFQVALEDIVRGELDAEEVRAERPGLVGGSGVAAGPVVLHWGPSMAQLELRAEAATAYLDRWPGGETPAHVHLVVGQGVTLRHERGRDGRPPMLARMRTLRIGDLREAAIDGLELEFPGGDGPGGLRRATAARVVLRAGVGLYGTEPPEGDRVALRAEGVTFEFAERSAIGAASFEVDSVEAEIHPGPWKRPDPEAWMADFVRAKFDPRRAGSGAPGAGAGDAAGGESALRNVKELSVASARWRAFPVGPTMAKWEVVGVRAVVQPDAARGASGETGQGGSTGPPPPLAAGPTGGPPAWVVRDLGVRVLEAGGRTEGAGYAETVRRESGGDTHAEGVTWEAAPEWDGRLRGIACRRVTAGATAETEPAFGSLVLEGVGFTLALGDLGGAPGRPKGSRGASGGGGGGAVATAGADTADTLFRSWPGTLASIAGTWEVRDGMVDLRIPCRGGEVAHLRVEEFRGRARSGPAGLSLEGLEGSVAGGRLTLSGTVGVRAGAGSEVTVEIAGVGADRLSSETPLRDQRLLGKLEGRARLTQSGRAGAGLGGGGYLWLSRGKADPIPVISAFVRAVQNAGDKDTSVTEGRVDFALEGQRIHYKEVLLSGPALSGCGDGYSRLDGDDLELHLVPRLGGETSGIPILGPITQKILDTVKGQLLEVEITGSLGEPRSSVVPLKLLTSPMRRFLGVRGGDGGAPVERPPRERR